MWCYPRSVSSLPAYLILPNPRELLVLFRILSLNIAASVALSGAKIDSPRLIGSAYFKAKQVLSDLHVVKAVRMLCHKNLLRLRLATFVTCTAGMVETVSNPSIGYADGVYDTASKPLAFAFVYIHLIVHVNAHRVLSACGAFVICRERDRRRKWKRSEIRRLYNEFSRCVNIRCDMYLVGEGRRC